MLNRGHGLISFILYSLFLLLGIIPIYLTSILDGYPQWRKASKHPTKEIENKPDLKFGLAEKEIERKFELLNQKRAYLDQNFNLTKCAQELEMPVHHVSYYLKSRFGKSFSSYKNSLRIEYAKKMIEDNFLKNSTMEALANECGFASRTSFSKAFKNVTGVSPSQYNQNIN